MFANRKISLFAAIALGTGSLAQPTCAEEPSAPGTTAPGELEMPMGDVWISREKPIDMPPIADLSPGIVGPHVEIPAGDVWPLPQTDLPRTAHQ